MVVSCKNMHEINTKLLFYANFKQYRPKEIDFASLVLDNHPNVNVKCILYYKD